MADLTTSTDDAIIFDINSPATSYDDFQSESGADTEDPAGGPRHHRPKGRGRDGAMNDPFPEMYVPAVPRKYPGGKRALRAQPQARFSQTPGAHHIQDFGTR